MDDILIKIHQKRHQKALFTLELFDAFSYLNVKDYFQVNLNIINIILYAVTFGIGIYYTINALDTITMGELSHLLHGKKGMPFLPIFIRVALTAIIALACTLICIIMIEKLFVKQMTFKQQLTQYAGILTPFIAV